MAAGTLTATAVGGAGAVSSVFGRTGAVTAQSGDYNCGQITGAACLSADNLFTGSNSFTNKAQYIYYAAIGTGLTGALQLINSTAAAAGAQQNSPSIFLQGEGWKTDGGGSSIGCQAAILVIPAQGASNPTEKISFQTQIAGAGWVERASVGSDGKITATSFVGSGADITAATITYSSIQNVSTNNRLLGRYTSGAGVMQEIGIDASLTMANGTLGVTAEVIQDFVAQMFVPMSSSTIRFHYYDSGGNITADVISCPANFLTGTQVEANLGTNQTLTLSAWNTLNIDTETTDSLGEFNTSTHTFTPASSGTYLITARATIGGVTTRNIIAVWNGTSSEVARLADGNLVMPMGTAMVTLVGGTGYTFRVFPVGSGTVTAQSGSGQTDVVIRRFY